MLRAKTFSEILQDMVEWVTTHTTKVTDFNQGSTLRTMLEAVAWVIKDIYADLFITFRTALKSFVYDAFGFGAQEATKAGGAVRFSADDAPADDIIIPIDTAVETADGIGFVTTAEGVLLAEQTVTADIPVAATVAGASGNVVAGAITSIVASVSGLTEVNNTLPTTGGRDAETDDRKQERFRKYVTNLGRSTVGGIEAGAETVNGVYQAQLVETSTPGQLELYVDDGSGGADQSLLNDVQLVIEGNMTDEYPGYRGAGTVITYHSAVKVEITLLQTLYVKAGADLTGLATAVEATETALINSYRMGVDLRLEAIRAEVMKAHLELKDIIINSPTANVPVAVGEVVKVLAISTTIVEVTE